MKQLITQKTSESLCSRYWGERRNHIVTLLYTGGIFGILVFLAYLLFVLPTPTVAQVKLMWWGLAPLLMIIVASLIPSKELLREFLSNEQISCPLEDSF